MEFANLGTHSFQQCRQLTAHCPKQKAAAIIFPPFQNVGTFGLFPSQSSHP
jgi:hypothetical protein